jgi:hypothetical protein
VADDSLGDGSALPDGLTEGLADGDGVGTGGESGGFGAVGVGTGGLSHWQSGLAGSGLAGSAGSSEAGVRPSVVLAAGAANEWVAAVCTGSRASAVAVVRAVVRGAGPCPRRAFDVATGRSGNASAAAGVAGTSEPKPFTTPK